MEVSNIYNAQIAWYPTRPLVVSNIDNAQISIKVYDIYNKPISMAVSNIYNAQISTKDLN